MARPAGGRRCAAPLPRGESPPVNSAGDRRKRLQRQRFSQPQDLRARRVRVLPSNVSDLESTAALTEAYSQLLSLAVHEFRTPASVVGGYLRMLQADTESALSERQRKMIADAARSCGRLVELINE